MDEVSLEHKEISKLWNLIVFFPNLYSQTRDWLSNSRHKKVHIFPFTEIFKILNLASLNVDRIKKVEELIETSSFNLDRVFVKDRQESFHRYRNDIDVNEYMKLEEFINFSNDTKELIERHMSNTYALKKGMDLIELLEDEYFINTSNKNIEPLKLLLLEIKYNLIKQNSNATLIELINKAIGNTRDLMATQKHLIDPLETLELKNDYFKKHLGIEDDLIRNIFEIKKGILNEHNNK